MVIMYRQKHYIRDGLILLLLLIFVPMILFVSPGAWWPFGPDNMPDILQYTTIMEIFISGQNVIGLLVMIVLAILVGKYLYDGI